MLGRVWQSLPGLPKLTSDVQIPVYLIHTDAGADDYFFLFDFETFSEQSKQGYFVRPRLVLWAGRDDFSRARFAALFRETFQAEFERMRDAHGTKSGNWGWFHLNLGKIDAEDEVAPVIAVAQVVLWVALLGPKVLSGLLGGSWFRRKRRAETEAKIASLRDQVDGVLQNIDVHLHEELYDQARRFHGPVQRSKVARDTWPLPTYVREHLNDNQSGSWW